MAQRAFIVKIDIEDGFEDQAVADEILDELLAVGFNVIEVNPWRAPSEELGNATAALGSIGIDPGDVGIGVSGVSGL